MTKPIKTLEDLTRETAALLDAKDIDDPEDAIRPLIESLLGYDAHELFRILDDAGSLNWSPYRFRHIERSLSAVSCEQPSPRDCLMICVADEILCKLFNELEG